MSPGYARPGGYPDVEAIAETVHFQSFVDDPRRVGGKQRYLAEVNGQLRVTFRFRATSIPTSYLLFSSTSPRPQHRPQRAPKAVPRTPPTNRGRSRSRLRLREKRSPAKDNGGYHSNHLPYRKALFRCALLPPSRPSRREHVSLGGGLGRANVGLKAMALVHSALAGGDWIGARRPATS